jgi:hypothetical protein
MLFVTHHGAVELDCDALQNLLEKLYNTFRVGLNVGLGSLTSHF